MRVLAFASDRSRCGYRLIWPSEQLARDGHDVTVQVPGWSAGELPVEGAEPPDVIVLQRPMHVRYITAVARFQEAGVAVVVELDDDMVTLSRRHVLWPSVQPKLSPMVNWRALLECCRMADLVTVTTPALTRRYGGHGRVAVIPNHVPASYLDVQRREHEGVTVGWSGVVATHPADLQITRGGVGRACASTGATFTVIGSRDGVREALHLPDEPAGDGFLPLEQYPDGLGQFDVGIAPLEGSAFNEAKSYLKPLEYAATGVPFVMSGTGPYMSLPAGVGSVAERGRQWESGVRRLVTSPEMRSEAAGRGREWAAGQTIERNAGMWWDAWERARVNASKRRRLVSA